MEASAAVAVGIVDDMIDEAVVEGTLADRADNAEVDVELAEEAVKEGAKLAFELAVLVNIEDKEIAVSEVGRVVGKSPMVAELLTAPTVSRTVNDAFLARRLPFASSILKVQFADLLGSRNCKPSIGWLF